MNILNVINVPLDNMGNNNQTLSKYLLGAHTQTERILVFSSSLTHTKHKMYLTFATPCKLFGLKSRSLHV